MEIIKFNEFKLNEKINLPSIAELNKHPFAKDVDKGIKQCIQTWFTSYLSEKINLFIEELKNGTKYENMPNDFKDLYKQLGDSLVSMKNDYGVVAIIKKNWDEDISIPKGLIIEYLNEYKKNTNHKYQQ